MKSHLSVNLCINSALSKFSPKTWKFNDHTHTQPRCWVVVRALLGVYRGPRSMLSTRRKYRPQGTNKDHLTLNNSPRVLTVTSVTVLWACPSLTSPRVQGEREWRFTPEVVTFNRNPLPVSRSVADKTIQNHGWAWRLITAWTTQKISGLGERRREKNQRGRKKGSREREGGRT